MEKQIMKKNINRYTENFRIFLSKKVTYRITSEIAEFTWNL